MFSWYFEKTQRFYTLILIHKDIQVWIFVILAYLDTRDESIMAADDWSMSGTMPSTSKYRNIPEIVLSLCYLEYTHGLSQDDPVMGIECIGLFLFHDRENIPGIATGTTSGCFNTGLPKIQLILRCSIPGDLGICTPGIDLLTYSWSSPCMYSRSPWSGNMQGICSNIPRKNTVCLHIFKRILYSRKCWVHFY